MAEAWKERVKKERTKLTRKIHKLKVYLDDPKVDGVDLQLLKTQLEMMIGYKMILDTRLARK